ncbi:MAG TPA: undecaprenyl-diphosphate phosphatase, partial [Patescibacteria group bacterium]|nr:undecaprenyl-diphosphate phosphatase [Patescibacteria group bacterium]
MIKYILLGIVQGFTEFLPVSSSAHLVIFQKLLGVRGQELAVSVILHVGTILALLVFFFKDIRAALCNRRLLWFILIVTVITGAIGVAGKDFFEQLFSSVKLVGAALLCTAAILLAAARFQNGLRGTLKTSDAVLLGLVQGIAIIPGISRSATTISTLLFKGLDKETSFRFSFLACIPAVLGAALLEARHIDVSLKAEALNLAVGFLFSFISGIAALMVLQKILQKARIHYFG